jgi:hypothetical protein
VSYYWVDVEVAYNENLLELKEKKDPISGSLLVEQLNKEFSKITERLEEYLKEEVKF